MAEDPATLLNNYKLQFQQVEAALTNDPDNEELRKLQKDLQEVITLTKDLLRTQTGEGTSTDLVEDVLAEDVGREWKIGAKCMAAWSEDGCYYEATIVDIKGDGHCNVYFSSLGCKDVTMLTKLKPAVKKRPPTVAGLPDEKQISKKRLMQAQREYKRKKAHKKAQRIKQLEEEREVEKGKWQDFNSKAFSKSKKGHVKKSIFASPDNINGRVGVGTCGIGGRPMTEYHQQEKWRRNVSS